MIGVCRTIKLGEMGRAYNSPDTWGFADIQAAVKVIADWTKAVAWEGPAVDVNRWLVSGHSNGGQYVTTSVLSPLSNSRSRDLVRSHSLAGQDHRRCASVGILIYTRFVDSRPICGC